MKSLKLVIKYVGYVVGGLLLVLCLNRSTVFAYDWSITKNTTNGRQDSGHVYSVKNTGNCDCTYNVKFSIIEQSGNVVIDSFPADYSIFIPKGKTYWVGTVYLHADKCQQGRLGTKVEASCTNSCGSAYDSGSALTVFTSSCGPTNYYACTDAHTCASYSSQSDCIAHTGNPWANNCYSSLASCDAVKGVECAAVCYRDPVNPNNVGCYARGKQPGGYQLIDQACTLGQPVPEACKPAATSQCYVRPGNPHDVVCASDQNPPSGYTALGRGTGCTVGNNPPEECLPAATSQCYVRPGNPHDVVCASDQNPPSGYTAMGQGAGCTVGNNPPEECLPASTSQCYVRPGNPHDVVCASDQNPPSGYTALGQGAGCTVGNNPPEECLPAPTSQCYQQNDHPNDIVCASDQNPPSGYHAMNLGQSCAVGQMPPPGVCLSAASQCYVRPGNPNDVVCASNSNPPSGYTAMGRGNGCNVASPAPTECFPTPTSQCYQETGNPSNIVCASDQNPPSGYSAMGRGQGCDVTLPAPATCTSGGNPWYYCNSRSGCGQTNSLADCEAAAATENAGHAGWTSYCTQQAGECSSTAAAHCPGGGGNSCNGTCYADSDCANAGISNPVCYRANPNDTYGVCRNSECTGRESCRCGGGGGLQCNSVCNATADCQADLGTAYECYAVTPTDHRCRLSSRPSSETCTTTGGGLQCNDACTPVTGSDPCAAALGASYACTSTGGGYRCRLASHPGLENCTPGGGGDELCGDGRVQWPNAAHDRGLRLRDPNCTGSDAECTYNGFEECDLGSANGAANSGCDTNCLLSHVTNSCDNCYCVVKEATPRVIGQNGVATYTVRVQNRNIGPNQIADNIRIHLRDYIVQINNDQISADGLVSRLLSFFNTRIDSQYAAQIGGSFRPDDRNGTFWVQNITPGHEVTIHYNAKGHTDGLGGRPFSEIVNKAELYKCTWGDGENPGTVPCHMEPLDDDTAEVNVSLAYLLTRNLGDVFSKTDFSQAAGLIDVKEVSEAIGDPTLVHSTTGLIMTYLYNPLKAVSSYLLDLGRAVTFNEPIKGSQMDPTTLSQQVTLNSQQVAFNVPTGVGGQMSVSTLDQAYTTLQRRPDNADVLVADGRLFLEGLDKFTVDRPVTIVVRGGDLVIKNNVEYSTEEQAVRPSIAFVVENGHLLIDPSVTRLDGVYVVLGEGRQIDAWGKTTSQPADRCRHAEGGAYCWYGSSEQLIINGSLYGDLQPLASLRHFAGVPAEDGGAIVINYDARIVTDTPPGLRTLLKDVWEKVIRK